jgi:hypothetical protein
MGYIVDVFQTDSEPVLKVFKESKNFLIEHFKIDSKVKCDEPVCAIYFSSHNIYFPNTSEAFEEQLIKKNRFEWYGTRVNRASKHIFLRDIKKQWYLNGINHEINSVERLLEFLKEVTKGFKIITIGSSAGGYAAVLFGQLLSAQSIFAFNGQFQLLDLLETTNEKINPILFRNVNNPEIAQYFSLKEFIINPFSIFYFCSKNSPWDFYQYNHVSFLEINFILIKSSHHGIPFLKSSLPKLINLNNELLSILSRKEYTYLSFSLKIEGFFTFLLNFLYFIIDYFKKKYFSIWK